MHALLNARNWLDYRYLSTTVAAADAAEPSWTRPRSSTTTEGGGKSGDVDEGEEAARMAQEEEAAAMEKDKRQRMLAGWILFACKFVSGALQVVAIEEAEVQAMLSAFVSLDQSL